MTDREIESRLRDTFQWLFLAQDQSYDSTMAAIRQVLCKLVEHSNDVIASEARLALSTFDSRRNPFTVYRRSSSRLLHNAVAKGLYHHDNVPGAFLTRWFRVIGFMDNGLPKMTVDELRAEYSGSSRFDDDLATIVVEMAEDCPLKTVAEQYLDSMNQYSDARRRFTDALANAGITRG